jgi:NAD(P)-dependent dehydrogenase (short-subunit alcohol dehydrogenase family)
MANSGESSKNKIPLAIVTGASQRLGKAIALELARNGYAIGLHYFQSQSHAENTSREIEKLGQTAILLQADLRDSCQIQDLFSRVPSDRFHLDILVNSAAVIKQKNLVNLTLEEWDNTLNINLRAPWLLSVEAAKMMNPSGGSIINISDTGTHKVWASYGAYLVSKSGLEMMTKLLAKTLAPSIRVNGVAPGLILPSPEMDPGEWEALQAHVPLKKSGDPRHIADAVLYLARHEYITGETLVVDGGYQLN